MCYGLVYGCCVSVIKLGVDLKVFEVMLWMLGWCSTCICVDAGTMIVCAVVCIFCELLCCFCCSYITNPCTYALDSFDMC